MQSKVILFDQIYRGDLVVLEQWKLQLSENCFNKFLMQYVEFTNIHIEKILKLKSYSNLGAILLDKVSIH